MFIESKPYSAGKHPVQGAGRRHRKRATRGPLKAQALKKEPLRNVITPNATQKWNYIVEMALSPWSNWHHDFTAISLVVKVLVSRWALAARLWTGIARQKVGLEHHYSSNEYLPSKLVVVVLLIV